MANRTVVRYMYIGHEQTVFSDFGIASELQITPVQRTKLPDDRTTTYFKRSWFIKHNLGLRGCTDRCPIEYTTFIADSGAIVDMHAGTYVTIISYYDVFLDSRKGANRYIFTDPGLGVNIPHGGL
jgi:hypothetical protein